MVNHSNGQHVCLSTKTEYIFIEHSYSKLLFGSQKIIINLVTVFNNRYNDF